VSSRRRSRAVGVFPGAGEVLCQGEGPFSTLRGALLPASLTSTCSISFLVSPYADFSTRRSNRLRGPVSNADVFRRPSAQMLQAGIKVIDGLAQAEFRRRPGHLAIAVLAAAETDAGLKRLAVVPETAGPVWLRP